MVDRLLENSGKASNLMIELLHCTKLYGTVMGVNDLCVDLKEGAYGLIGPNGSGKTTFINLLTGNLRPSQGQVRIGGKDPWTDRSVLQIFGLCPATDLLLPNVSALAWVQYMLGLAGFKRADARRLALESLKRVGMEHAMHRAIDGYSLGMRQRTKLAQAIAHDPQWLILDEPFNGLDPLGRQELSDLIRFWREGGRGLLLASHVLHEVESVTSEFLMIHGGRVLASGSAMEVQSMLVDFPKEVQIRGERLEGLMQALVGMASVQSIQWTKDRDRLSLGIRDPLAFFQSLMELVAVTGAYVSELSSPEGNLSMAFDTLLKAHRGEIE